MEEIIVEGLDYEDFKTLKEILCNNTTTTMYGCSYQGSGLRLE